MEYLKTVVPSQLISERGSNVVVLNPGSANVRIGLASQDTPLIIPHCIARRTNRVPGPKRNVQDQMRYSPITTAQHMDRERAYDSIASLLKIPFLDEEIASNSFPRKMGRVDGNNLTNNRKETSFPWTNTYEKEPVSSLASESSGSKDGVNESLDQHESYASEGFSESIPKYKEFICGDDALKISPMEPYCLHRPICRGHFNISQHYSMQQVFEDLHAIWDWILTEKLHISHNERSMYSAIIVVPESFDNRAILDWILMEKLHISHNERSMYSAIIVVPESFDNREIKETLTIVLRDLHFTSAVVHQEAIATAFGNGLSTACIVNMGAHVTSVTCIEDGVALPITEKTLPFGGEDISRCLLWTQRHHQTWPPIRTDLLTKPIDLLMLNRLKESYCEIQEGELDAVAVVHSYEDGISSGSHKTRLTALNVPPMGLFYPMLLVPDVYPPPPRSWFHDYEDMLEDTWHMEFPRRPDISDGFYAGYNVNLPMLENYPVFASKPKKEEKVGIAEAITSSILSTGRIDLQRKLFCSILLVGGVALTNGLVPIVEDRVLLTIPANEAIDTVEVLPSRTNPAFVSWKGGAILGVLDVGREAWIHREDWINNGVHIGSGRKYKDSYYLQAQAMCHINS